MCNRPDKELRRLRIARAYIKLLCLPEGEERFIALVCIGIYEVRMLDVYETNLDDKPLFCLQLFDREAQKVVENCICHDIEEGVAAFEKFISR